MAGTIDSTSDPQLNRLFRVRFASSPRPGAWILRLRPEEPWTDEEIDAWSGLLHASFTELAVLAELSSSNAPTHWPPTTTPANGVRVDRWVEWRFEQQKLNSAWVALLLNLCEWGSDSIASVTHVELLSDTITWKEEPRERPFPTRNARLSFALDEVGQPGEGLSIVTEFARELTEEDDAQITEAMAPWLNAVFQWGFMLPQLAAGKSIVRPNDPFLEAIDDLWCVNFEHFAARYEAVDVFLNCIESIHRHVIPVRLVAIE